MSAEILERLRRDRRIEVTVGKWKFVASRPSMLKMGELANSDGSISIGRLALEFVTGWENVVTGDLYGNDGRHPVEFDRAIWQVWGADRPDVVGPIGEQIMAAYSAHAEKLRATLGNSNSDSTST